MEETDRKVIEEFMQKKYNFNIVERTCKYVGDIKDVVLEFVTDICPIICEIKDIKEGRWGWLAFDTISDLVLIASGGLSFAE